MSTNDQLPPIPGNIPEAEQTLLSHLIELRGRLVKAVLTIMIVFIVLVPFAQEIFSLVANPLMSQLPENATMIATQVASPFLTPFKTTFFVALFLSMPIIFFQIWQFIAPGLYKNEQRFAFPLLFSSIFLFYLGIAFAYFVVFPIMFGFFASASPEGVTMMTDIGAYLDFILTLFFAFGISFQVPIATFMLVSTGLVSIEKLKSGRAYVFLGAFVLGMFLTPPDAISQTLLAIPVYVLYELGILLSGMAKKNKDDNHDK
jgi:sec-independent protein translocase protein TatC